MGLQQSAVYLYYLKPFMAIKYLSKQTTGAKQVLKQFCYTNYNIYYTISYSSNKVCNTFFFNKNI